MKIKYFLIMMSILLTSFYSLNAQTKVNSLAEFREIIQESNKEIILEPGQYNLEDLDSDSRIISFSGSNNTIDLSGVHIKVPVGIIRESYILVPGSNNTIKGGEIEDIYRNGLTEITDFVAYHQDGNNLAYGLRGAAVMTVSGENNLINGIKLTVRGSHLYGYGSMYGINQYNTFGMNKRCGLLINGAKNTLDNVEVQMRAFGHGIYMQGEADETVIKNSLVEGRVRAYADLYKETDPNSFPYRSDYKLPETSGTDYDMPFSSSVLPIPTDEVFSLSEDGIRAYTGTGSVIVENCTVKKMRGGIRLYLGGKATVTNSLAIDCGSTNFNLSADSSIANSSGNFAYAPLSDFRLGRSRMDIELTIIPSPNAEGSHNIADIQGNNHNIIFHRTPGAIDTTTRAIVVTGNNSTIVNETEYSIILEEGTSGNKITSCGKVTDKGSNSVDNSNDCDFEEEEITTELPLDKDGTLVRITKRNASGYAIDGGNGGANGQAVTLSAVNASDEGQLWLEIDRGNGFYSYEKYGTNYSLDGNRDGANNQIVYLWETKDNNQNQQWQKQAQGDGSYKLIKRNATGYTINGGSGGVEGRDITLWDSSRSHQNLQWYIDPIVQDIRIEAEDYDEMSGIQTEASTESGDNVGYINNSDWLLFKDINLSGFSNLDMRIASRYKGGTIEVRTGSTSGELIGFINVTNTGGDQNWITKNSDLSNASGVEDIYLVFTGGNGYLFNINWIEFNNSSTSNKDIIVNIDDLEVSIYPNPVVSTTTVYGAANTTINIYSLSGRIVYSKSIINESEIINLSSLASGMYYSQIKGKESTSIIKLIKK